MARVCAVLALAVGGASAFSAVAPTGRSMLTKNIKTPDPIPQEGIELATKAMQAGKLYRYNVATAEESILSRCEEKIAAFTVRTTLAPSLPPQIWHPATFTPTHHSNLPVQISSIFVPNSTMRRRPPARGTRNSEPRASTGRTA